MAAEYKERKRDLSVTDRLALCGVAVMGKDYALQAYKMSHRIKTDNPASLSVMVSRWMNSNKAKGFLNEIKQLYADTLLANADEGEELNEGQLIRIIERGIVSEKDPKRQADMSLKLMAWKKESQVDSEASSRRSFYIPYKSACRVCEIMGWFKELQMNGSFDKESFEAIATRGIYKLLATTRQKQTEARERINAGNPAPGDEGLSDAVATIFVNILSWEDILDIYDIFQRVRKGSSQSKPHWVK